MKKDELLETLYDFIRDRFSRITTQGVRWNMDVGTCYTVSKIGAKILKRCGYNAYPVKVMLTCANEQGRKNLEKQKKKGVYNPEETIKKGGWAVGIGHEHNGKKGSHWQIYFEDEDMVMDLTYEQASRPQYDLICKPFFEKADELPENIVEIIRVKPEIEGYLYLNEEPIKSYLKTVIKDGVKLLKRKKLLNFP